MPFVHCCVLGFHFGFEIWVFFRLDFEFCWFGWKEFLPSRARVERERIMLSEVNSLCSGKGWEWIGSYTETLELCTSWRHRHSAWVSRVLVTLAQPPGHSHSQSHRYIQESASSPSPPSENTMEVTQLCHPYQGTSCGGLILGSWWPNSWRTCDKGMVGSWFGGSQRSQERKTSHTTDLQVQALLVAPLREILSILPCCFVLWVSGLSPLFLIQVNTHRLWVLFDLLILSSALQTSVLIHFIFILQSLKPQHHSASSQPGLEVTDIRIPAPLCT